VKKKIDLNYHVRSSLKKEIDRLFTAGAHFCNLNMKTPLFKIKNKPDPTLVPTSYLSHALKKRAKSRETVLVI
jgi:hypothetical protein